MHNNDHEGDPYRDGHWKIEAARKRGEITTATLRDRVKDRLWQANEDHKPGYTWSFEMLDPQGQDILGLPALTAQARHMSSGVLHAIQRRHNPVFNLHIHRINPAQRFIDASTTMTISCIGTLDNMDAPVLSRSMRLQDPVDQPVAKYKRMIPACILSTATVMDLVVKKFGPHDSPRAMLRQLLNAIYRLEDKLVPGGYIERVRLDLILDEQTITLAG